MVMPTDDAPDVPDVPDAPDVKELYERYGRAVYRRCQYFLRNDEDARDAMHEVFVKVVQRYGEFKGESSPLTWLVRIATNHCLNILRSRKARWHDRYEQTVKIESRSRPDDYGRFERHELVHAILAKVDPKIPVGED